MSKVGKAFGMLLGKKPDVPTPSSVVYEKLEVKSGAGRMLFVVGTVLVVVSIIAATLFIKPISMRTLEDFGALFSNSTRLAYVIGFLASLVPPALVMFWIFRSDRYEPEPRYALAVAIGVGAALSAVASPLVILGKWGLIGLLAAPFIYESFKVAGLVVLLTSKLQKELNDHVDGFVYGAAVGTGFAVVNSSVAFIISYLSPAPALMLLGTPVAGLVLIQALNSVLHILSGGFAGFWLGYERVLDGVVDGRDLIPALTIALVIGYLGTIPEVLGVAGIALKTVVVGYFLYTTERILMAALKDEVAWGYAEGKAPVES